VVAIGNALGRGGAPTVTDGTVSDVGRSIAVAGDNGSTEHLTNVIQSTAPISPGDSGGALVNAAGQVVGMITAGSSNGPARHVSAVGFAIAANSASTIVTQIQSGHASSEIVLGQRGFLGVGVKTLDAATAAQLGLTAGSGVLVANVIAGTPAAHAGMTAPAVITAVDGTKVASPEELGPAIYAHTPGETIRVTWVDGTGTHSTTVALIAGPAV
jgi:S1-C subfamily serine protease